MTAHVAAWIVKETGAATMDDLWLFYCEVRASGLQLDHECENPGCRNPDHVFPRTQTENIQAGKDRAMKRYEKRAPARQTCEEDEVLPF